VDQRGGQAHNQIKGHVPDPAQSVFDIVAEDPQKQHISGNVKKPAMQKH